MTELRWETHLVAAFRFPLGRLIILGGPPAALFFDDFEPRSARPSPIFFRLLINKPLLRFPRTAGGPSRSSVPLPWTCSAALFFFFLAVAFFGVVFFLATAFAMHSDLSGGEFGRSFVSGS